MKYEAQVYMKKWCAASSPANHAKGVKGFDVSFMRTLISWDVPKCAVDGDVFQVFRLTVRELVKRCCKSSCCLCWV